MLLPAKTPAEIVNRLNREVVAILKSPDVKEKLAAQGAEVLAGTPAEFIAAMKAEIAKWTKVTSGLTLQTN